MKALRSLQSLIHRYESRSLRERILLLVCLLVVLFFLWDTAVMNPLDLRKKRDRKQSNELRIELTELTTRQTRVEAHKGFDPDRENRLKLARLQSEVADIQRQLEVNVVNLVSPQEMPELLKNLLTQQQRLQLLSLENLPAEVLQVNEQATEDPLSPVLYRHRLRLEFVGDYLAILAYLNKLEELPRGMVWEKLEIETQQYPQARARLQVYTLSLNRGWIGG